MTVYCEKNYLLVAVVLLLHPYASGTGYTGWNAGFSFSFVPSNEPDNFNYFEFQGIRAYNVAHYEDIISLMIGYGGALGLLKHKSEKALLLDARFEIGPSLFNDVAMLVLTTGPAVITRYRYSNHDFGGPITFLSSVGITINPYWKISVGWRVQHMSNANLFRKNHRLNLHVLELKYNF